MKGNARTGAASTGSLIPHGATERRKARTDSLKKHYRVKMKSNTDLNQIDVASEEKGHHGNGDT